jgi:hypothetical protein
MITQYDARAEIEAMKVARSRRVGQTSTPAAGAGSSPWTNASEHAIRAEMERRLVRRSMASGSSEVATDVL